MDGIGKRANRKRLGKFAQPSDQETGEKLTRADSCRGCKSDDPENTKGRGRCHRESDNIRLPNAGRIPDRSGIGRNCDRSPRESAACCGPNTKAGLFPVPFSNKFCRSAQNTGPAARLWDRNRRPAQQQARNNREPRGRPGRVHPDKRRSDIRS